MYKAYLLTSSTPETRIVRLYKKEAITFSPGKDTTSHTQEDMVYSCNSDISCLLVGFPIDQL